MKFYAIIFSIVLFILLSLFGFEYIQKEKIKIGIIHSQSGTMAMSEKSVLDATIFAIEQINAEGGILGKKLEAVVVDGKSSDTGFEEALDILLKNGVTTIFGGWTSSSRKAMKTALEKEDALLFYPIQYEGFESSENIIYLGLTPNQQVIPTINYAVEKFGRTLFLVGSDYIYPQVTNKFINSVTEYFNLKIVGEEYKLLGATNFDDTIEKIKSQKPSFIINTLNGDSNIAFFKALSDNNISLINTPVFSFSITENELEKISQYIGTKALEGSYLTWSYFSSIESKENQELKSLFKKRFGNDIIVTDPMYTAYMGVKLYEQNVKKHGCYKTKTTKKNLAKESIGGVAGVVAMDAKNNHTWKEVRIAKINADAKAVVIWESEALQKAKPFPEYINTHEMLNYEKELYQRWNSRYEASKEYR